MEGNASRQAGEPASRSCFDFPQHERGALRFEFPQGERRGLCFDFPQHERGALRFEFPQGERGVARPSTSSGRTGLGSPGQALPVQERRGVRVLQVAEVVGGGHPHPNLPPRAREGAVTGASFDRLRANGGQGAHEGRPYVWVWVCRGSCLRRNDGGGDGEARPAVGTGLAGCCAVGFGPRGPRRRARRCGRGRGRRSW